MLQNIHRNKVFGKNSSLAFTVIELFTSIFIVAILTAILSVVLNIGIRAYRQADEIIEITNKAQQFFGQICRELPGAIVSLSPDVSFVGTGTNIYFMAPWENSSDIELCEIGYNFVGNDINRHFITRGTGAAPNPNFEYPNNPVNYAGEPEQFFIDLGNDSSVIFSYDGIGNWNSNTSLPQIVEIGITMEDSRDVSYTFTTRIFLPGSTNNP